MNLKKKFHTGENSFFPSHLRADILIWPVTALPNPSLTLVQGIETSWLLAVTVVTVSKVVAGVRKKLPHWWSVGR